MKNIFNFLKKKQKITDSEKIKPSFTIEEFETKYGIELTYPNINLLDYKGDIEACVKDLNSVNGCSDIWYDNSWLHKDCWPGKNGCKKCWFYPIKKKYLDSQNIDNKQEDDFTKADAVLSFFNAINKKQNIDEE